MLTELTKEQEAAIPKWRDKGLEIGLSTDPIPPKEELMPMIAAAYAAGGINTPPKSIYVFDSPDEAVKAWAAMFKEWSAGTTKADGFTEDGVRAKFADLTKKETKDAFSKIQWCYGVHDSFWITFYQFFRKECDVKTETDLDPLAELSAKIGWWIPMDEMIIVTRKPLYIKMEQQRLHSRQGPAIEFADGMKVYAMNGVRFPDEQSIKFAETPADQINVGEIFEIKNVEIRSEVIKKVGLLKCLDKLDPKVLDTLNDYRLLEVTLGNYPVVKLLQMVNPSTGETHLEGVHDDCQTVNQARSYRNFGKISDDFEEPIMLT